MLESTYFPIDRERENEREWMVFEKENETCFTRHVILHLSPLSLYLISLSLCSVMRLRFYQK